MKHNNMTEYNMKRVLILILLMIPSVSFADALDDYVGALIDATNAGSALGVCAALILVICEVIKRPWAGAVWQRVPKRWRIALPILLSGVAGALTSIVAGVHWREALVVALLSGPSAVFLHEAIIKALLGRSDEDVHRAETSRG
jgi:hypothetical protein